MQRRSFLKNSSLALVAAGGARAIPIQKQKKDGIGPSLALNAYSFSRPLLGGSMSLEELFSFAAKTGFEAVDLTAYYIPGYPEVPEDRVLFDIKKMAFRLGIGISGTGVRNDFTVSDPEELKSNIKLVKNWIVAASKLGVPHVRVFAGKGEDNVEPRKNVKSRIITSLQECADFAENHGVMVAFQNHHDFIKSTKETIEIVEGVKSDWFGLMIDIGSITATDVYGDIEKLIPHAITWQVKENVRSGGVMVPTDFEKLMKIVHRSKYTGYFPVETLGEGDPIVKVTKLVESLAPYFS